MWGFLAAHTGWFVGMTALPGNEGAKRGGAADGVYVQAQPLDWLQVQRNEGLQRGKPRIVFTSNC